MAAVLLLSKMNVKLQAYLKKMQIKNTLTVRFKTNNRQSAMDRT